MAKTANLYARIEAEAKIPPTRVTDVSILSDAEMNAELEKGYDDIEAGRVKSAKSAFVLPSDNIICLWRCCYNVSIR